MASVQELEYIESEILQWEGERHIIWPHDQTPPLIYDESEQHNPIEYKKYSIWFQKYT